MSISLHSFTGSARGETLCTDHDVYVIRVGGSKLKMRNILLCSYIWKRKNKVKQNIHFKLFFFWVTTRQIIFTRNYLRFFFFILLLKVCSTTPFGLLILPSILLNMGWKRDKRGNKWKYKRMG